MKKTTIASLIGLAFAPLSFAAETVILDDVVVTASRTSQARESVIADVTVINKDQIERAGQSSLTELLRAEPSIEISSNGGAGTASNIFLRGTNSDHVVVLIDGMRVNSATLGTTAFENLPIEQIERIEILRGPATSLYGQDAIGGVIQIFTKKGEGPPTFSVSAGYGSYNTKVAKAGVNGKSDHVQYSLNISSKDTDSFSAKNYRSGRQSDDDGYRNLSASGALSYTFTEGHELGLQFLSSEGRYEYDSSNTYDNYATQSQASYNLYSKNQFYNNWLSTLRIGEGVDDSTDHSSPTNRTVTRSKQRQYSWQNDIGLSLGTLSLLYDRLEQRVVSTTNYDNTSRNNDGFTASYLVNKGNHSIQASYRSDHNTEYGTHDTGAIGYGYSLTPNWRISGNFGTAFKAPTFNQLYYPFGVGNPNIKPEISRNAEMRLRYDDDSLSLSATIFNNKIKDLIEYDLATSSFNNVNQARIKGLSLAGSKAWHNWNLSANADFQSPKDEKTDHLLGRRAYRHGAANLSYVVGKWRFGSEMVASSARYNETANTKHLGGYALLNLTSEYAINGDLKLQARLNNALNKDYTLAYDTYSDVAYNTPGSNLFINLSYSPSK
jgi:vitamin B12 transporter